ncbi:MAG: hypothetical protein AMJ92_06330 [candidate division Zixibacteria bacterium SM23_81]|nr:MAG: hypothetical protein AMJ92_06330 [candidate division Zixibacteria bacterium SM23_81]
MADLEGILRPPERQLPPYPPKSIYLATGEQMVVRPAVREETSMLLEAIAPLLYVERDFYDIVAARTFAELLGWKRYRVKDEYCLVGLIDGQLVGLVNGRTLSSKVGISYHTLALRRGLRVGAHLFASKMEYHIEILKQKYVYITAESPIGFRRWMLEYDLIQRPDIPHELGGVDVWTLTPELYHAAKDRLVVGERPVPAPLLKTAETITIPEEAQLVQQVTGRAKKRSS